MAEGALAKLTPYFPAAKSAWTARAPLPGGDFLVGDVARLTAELQQNHAFLTPYWAARLIRAYGADAVILLQGVRSAADLGRDFGATLTEVEVRWLMAHEFARAADDVVWRRTKLGLRMNQAQIAVLEEFMAQAYNQT